MNEWWREMNRESEIEFVEPLFPIWSGGVNREDQTGFFQPVAQLISHTVVPL